MKRRLQGRAASMLTVALMTACAPNATGGAGGVGDSAADTVTGTVQVVGSAPVNVQVVLRPPEGSAIRLEGSLAEELGRARGAQVTVRGALGPSPDPLAERIMQVTGYEIDAVNGQAVVTGEVIAVEGGTARLRTADGTELDLTGAPASFRVGQKVWVQGPRVVTVQSYGTLRP